MTYEEGGGSTVFITLFKKTAELVKCGIPHFVSPPINLSKEKRHYVSVRKFVAPNILLRSSAKLFCFVCRGWSMLHNFHHYVSSNRDHSRVENYSWFSIHCMAMDGVDFVTLWSEAPLRVFKMALVCGKSCTQEVFLKIYIIPTAPYCKMICWQLSARFWQTVSHLLSHHPIWNNPFTG